MPRDSGFLTVGQSTRCKKKQLPSRNGGQKGVHPSESGGIRPLASLLALCFLVPNPKKFVIFWLFENTHGYTYYRILTREERGG